MVRIREAASTRVRAPRDVVVRVLRGEGASAGDDGRFVLRKSAGGESWYQLKEAPGGDTDVLRVESFQPRTFLEEFSVRVWHRDLLTRVETDLADVKRVSEELALER